MADEENFIIMMLPTHNIEKGFEVIQIVREAFNMASQSIRLAMSSIIMGTDGIAFGHEVVDQVRISPRVFSQAVGNQQYRLWLSIWQPALIVKGKSFAP